MSSTNKVPPAFHGAARQLLEKAYNDAGGRLPEALSDEEFQTSAGVALFHRRPDTLECCARIQQRCVFDAVNEALELLWTTKPPPRTRHGKPSVGGLSLLSASASESRVAQLSLEDATAKLLALLPSPSSDDLTLPDDVGAATRMLWKQLSPEWTSYGEDEWAAARAQLPRGGGDEEARSKLAAEIFWEGREALLLTDDDLHDTLWAALCRYVSPPYPEPREKRTRSRSQSPKEDNKDGAKTDRTEGGDDEEDGKGSEEGEEEGEEDEDDDEEDGTFARIHYDDFLLALNTLDSKKAAPLKSARAFLSLRLDEYGRASIHSVYALACSLTQLLSTRVQLALLEDERGRLTEVRREQMMINPRTQATIMQCNFQGCC